MSHKPNEKWPEAKKVEVVTTYLAVGKAPLVEALTKVPAGTIRQWKTQPWWKEMVDTIQTESNQELDSRLTKQVDKALEVVMDRLEHGEFILDSKTGEIIRRPVQMKDANKVFNDVFDKRQLIRKSETEHINQEAIGDILKGLASEFAKFAKKNRGRIVEGELVDAEKLPS